MPICTVTIHGHVGGGGGGGGRRADHRHTYWQSVATVNEVWQLQWSSWGPPYGSLAAMSGQLNAMCSLHCLYFVACTFPAYSPFVVMCL